MTAKKKSTPKSTPPLRTPAHGHGKLRLHGTPGNKGGTGRPSDAFKLFCQQTLAHKDVQAGAVRIAKDPDHPAWKGAVEWLAKYGHHELVSNVDVTSKGESLAGLIRDAFKP